MRTLLAAALAALAIAPAAEARSQPAPYLGITESELAVTEWLRTYTLPPFTDRQAKIRVHCWKVSRAANRCRASFTADRLSGRVRASVREYVKQDGSGWYTIRMGGLQID